MNRKKSLRKTILGLAFVLLAGLIVPLTVFAEGEDSNGAASEHSQDDDASQEESEQQNIGTRISLTPVSKVLQIASSHVYEDIMTVNNGGDEDMKIEVYAAPYSYVYSEEENLYKLGFSKETNFTQISRWITFEKTDGSWDKKAIYTIPPHESLGVKYKISTPNSIPAGGQYAVIFAHTLTSSISASGIKTEASPGMVVFGRSGEGEIIKTAQISEMTAAYGTMIDSTKDLFYGSAKVKNDGNIDFNATGVLEVSPIIGFSSYKTDEEGGRGKISVIPEAELTVSDRWDNSPAFGLYKVTWTVSVDDQVETVESIVFVNPIIAIIIIIIVLTIITIWTILVIRRRRDRRSRLAV